VPRESALNIVENSFHLAVLSANKGRCVVREWVTVSLADLREHLRRFLAALCLIRPGDDTMQVPSIVNIVRALESENPNLTRGLLRTAYLGQRPPSALLGSAVPRLRTLWAKGRQKDERERMVRLHALTAAIKLAIFYGKGEVDSMVQLDPGHKSAAYLCGRLLAVLERAQLQAANFNLNTTIVDRFYGAASTAPASVFGNLIRLTTTAHLPNVGRELNQLMEEVMSFLDEAGGFPRTLTTAQQGEFALGFYHQRAVFRARQSGSQQT
jgi:CRISPR-associated protein Csd1